VSDGQTDITVAAVAHSNSHDHCTTTPVTVREEGGGVDLRIAAV